MQENGKSSGKGVEWKLEISCDTVHSAATFTDLSFNKHLLYDNARQRAETEQTKEERKWLETPVTHTAQTLGTKPILN